MDKIALVVIGDGRKELLVQTIASAYRHLKGELWQKIMISDAGDTGYTAWLDSLYPDWRIFAPVRRMGLANSVQLAWQMAGQADYIFHLEEDFLFNEDIDLEHMISLLKQDPSLAQMMLRRQPWAAEGPEGYLGDNPDFFEDHEGYLTHTQGFWLNPCIYPVSVTDYGWPDGGGEAEFTAAYRRLEPNHKFGIYGSRNDPPRVNHIGSYRANDWKV